MKSLYNFKRKIYTSNKIELTKIKQNMDEYYKYKLLTPNDRKLLDIKANDAQEEEMKQKEITSKAFSRCRGQ